MPTAAFADLAVTLDRLASERDLSGSFLLTAGGETVFEHCCGYADRANGVPITPSTRLPLASLTKMFTAATVTSLVASGRLTFDARVIDVLPPDRRPSTLAPEVSVHHLLCHTSGIADYCEEDEASPEYVADYGSLWDDLPSYSMERPVDFLPLFGEKAPYRSAGLSYQYSNAGYILLGLIVEELTGRPFIEAVQSHVFDRAGMHDSGFFRSDEAVPDVALGYLQPTNTQGRWRSNIHQVPVIGGPDGGAHCTARDVDRFLHAYTDGTLLGDLKATVLARHAAAAGGFAYGYGVLLWPDGRLGHDGGDPGVEVLATRWPEADVNLVALCNMEDMNAEVRTHMIAEAKRADLLRSH